MTIAAASETFRFKPPYKMADHGSTENGINRIDIHIEDRELLTVLNDAVAGFAHLYAYGVSKCTFLAGLTGRPIHNLEDINCPPPDSLNHERLCTLSCQNRAFPLRLVDVLSAEERFRLIPTRHDTSYYRFCCSPINRPCTMPTQSLCFTATMATRRKRSYNAATASCSKRMVLLQIQEEVEQLPFSQPFDICTYWPPQSGLRSQANPATPHVLLQRR